MGGARLDLYTHQNIHAHARMYTHIHTHTHTHTLSLSLSVTHTLRGVVRCESDALYVHRVCVCMVYVAHMVHA